MKRTEKEFEIKKEINVSFLTPGIVLHTATNTNLQANYSIFPKKIEVRLFALRNIFKIYKMHIVTSES